MKDEPEPPDFGSISDEEEVAPLEAAVEIEPEPVEAKTE
jgi:hypothetical protein